MTDAGAPGPVMHGRLPADRPACARMRRQP
ncbi:hypothetical protein SAMN05444389_101290 [Paracoccus solventivorans]|uniref:Uncharacterized protein n=1 Tax=Paracoccus solventivorans TaxID=53463 RepID=A0A1M7DD42_9RHOB|nr:hypothetical protein SAMN05444389_101290 [Paracoccus solventivorans]